MKIQSNGMGVQSVAMYILSSLEILPVFDYSIFADPGKEKKETYEYLDVLKDWSQKKSRIRIPIIHDKSKNLYQDLLNNSNSTGQRFASIPGYTLNEDGTIGMLRRQCTHEYKILVVEDNIRKIFGIDKRQSYPEIVELYIGISLDEIKRIAKPHRKNVRYVYPFCNWVSTRKRGWREGFTTLTRADLINIILEQNLPLPPKSSCIFCPFQVDYNWLKHKQNGEWNDIIAVDNAIRNSSKKGIKQKVFLHKSCKPIDEVELNENQMKIDFNCGAFCNI